MSLPSHKMTFSVSARSILTLLICIGIIVAGFLTKNFLSSFAKEGKKRPKKAEQLRVDAKIAELATQSPLIEGRGRIQSTDRMDLVPEVSGLIMMSPYALQNGSWVKKGQVLFSIQPSTAQNQFKMSITDLMNALAQVLPDLKSDMPESYVKWQKFFSSMNFENLPSLPEVDNDREKLFLTRFSVFKLYFVAKNLKTQLEKHVIRAPFSGTIINTSTAPGTMARAGSPVAKLIRSSSLEIEIPLPVATVKNLSKGSSVEIELGSGVKIEGKIKRLSKVLDESTQSRSVFVSMPGTKNKEIFDGMYAIARIQGSALKNSVSVPRNAIYQNQALLVKEGKLKIVPVEISARDMTHSYITAGIQNGDTVIVSSIKDPFEGQKVKVNLSLLK